MSVSVRSHSNGAAIGSPLARVRRRSRNAGRSLAQHGESPDDGAGPWNQIRAAEQYSIPDRPQPALKPTRGQDGLPEAHQEEVTAGSEGRIRRLKRLEAERIQAQILL